jgi:four helix bundle protein
MKSYHDLEIYQESKSLAIEVHKMTLRLPKFELYEEGGQIRRSSKAVTSAIVEGYGRKRYKNDFIKYLVISHTECDETLVHLDFLFETGSMQDKDLHNRFKEAYSQVSKKIYNYIVWVEANWKE